MDARDNADNTPLHIAAGGSCGCNAAHLKALDVDKPRLRLLRILSLWLCWGRHFFLKRDATLGWEPLVWDCACTCKVHCLN